MAIKSKQQKGNDSAPVTENWRKPLQVPPRADAMRSFYQGGEDLSNQSIGGENQAISETAKIVKPVKTERAGDLQSPTKKLKNKRIASSEETLPLIKPDNREIVSKVAASEINQLTTEELSQRLGIDIDDLFDIHELLRGKSFEIYQTLLKSCDEKGRCKMTQPELMKQTNIKNRRTFYKHEDWLINLKLLEKRHLPGDHKGVVYRVLRISEVLPINSEMLEKFENRLKNIE